MSDAFFCRVDATASRSWRSKTPPSRKRRSWPPVRSRRPAGAADEGRTPTRRSGEFCRVAATLTPTSDSDIKIEIWLPMPRAAGAPGNTAGTASTRRWANGGWAGVISYSAMAEALQGGYATASTDTGHEGGRGTFALGHPEKLVDFAWRSEHEMTAKAKQVIEAFYGAGPKLSYWNGCSTGGRQGLKAAQMFPRTTTGSSPARRPTARRSRSGSRTRC
jgi:feruloyl esterase